MNWKKRRDLPAPVPADKLAHLDHDQLKALAEDRLRELTEQQQAFALSYASHGDALRAASEAGYSSESLSDLARRSRRNPKVQSAVRAIAALRSSEASYDLEGVQSLLEGMIDVSAEDFLVRNANGDVIGVKDQSLLSAAERARLKKLEARIRRSAKGERSHIVNVTVELVPVFDVMDRLSKLRGWSADSALVNIATLGETHVSAPASLDPILASLADAVLDDVELRRFVRADDDTKREMLRVGIARLREAA